MEQYKSTITSTYNVNETSITSVGEPEIILTEKGQKRTRTLASG